ncbi:MAG: 6-phosphogluconolactonase [Bacteroidota bacterium]
MQTLVFENAVALAAAAARELVSLLKHKPGAVVCMASGNSPKLTCEAFVTLAATEGIDTSRFFFIGLDEWVGITPDTPGSCHNDFRERLFLPLNMDPQRYHLFDGMSADLEQECRKMDQVILDKGGIDLMIVGIGMNGHIGFNEPGCDMNAPAHVAKLEDITASVGQKYFNTPMKLEYGITIGLGHLKNSRRVLLIANGSSKAQIVHRAIHGPVSSELPASVMQSLDHGMVMIDQDCAGAGMSRG